MFQAQQKQLIQEANIQLLAIRQSEMDYFLNFFQNIGFNAAIASALIAGSISQVPGFENPTNTWYGFCYLYWFSSAFTVLFSVASLISAMFVSVFGQGLGLRGPTGSMVRALEGMVDEQQKLFYCFTLTIFFFGLQLIGMYFIMMDSTSGWICGVITLIAMVSWYLYSLRLYNRFSWKDVDMAWQENNNQGPGKRRRPRDDDDDDPLKRFEQSLSQKSAGSSSRSATSLVIKDVMDQERNQLDAAIAQGLVIHDNFDEFAHSGFMSLLIPGKRSFFSLSKKAKEHSGQWKRRFFVIVRTKLYYYTDRRAFELDPEKPLNVRPIDLNGYTMVAGAQEAPYYISLSPADPEDDRRAWKFRCDTVHEFQAWTEALIVALKQCPSWRESETGEFVDMAHVPPPDSEFEE